MAACSMGLGGLHGCNLILLGICQVAGWLSALNCVAQQTATLASQHQAQSEV